MSFRNWDANAPYESGWNDYNYWDVHYQDYSYQNNPANYDYTSACHYRAERSYYNRQANYRSRNCNQPYNSFQRRSGREQRGGKGMPRSRLWTHSENYNRRASSWPGTTSRAKKKCDDMPDPVLDIRTTTKELEASLEFDLPCGHSIGRDEMYKLKAIPSVYEAISEGDLSFAIQLVL